MKKLIKLLLILILSFTIFKLNTTTKASSIETGVSIRLEKELDLPFEKSLTFVVTNNYDNEVTLTNFYIEFEDSSAKFELNQTVSANSTYTFKESISKDLTIVSAKLYVTSTSYGTNTVNCNLDSVHTINSLLFIIPIIILLLITVFTSVSILIPRIRNKKLQEKKEENSNE